MSNKMAPDLGKLDELAKVHAASYASPHHFTMSVNGLREVVAALQLPAGNKMALDALTKILKIFERDAFDIWLEAKSPSGDVEQVQRQWESSSEYSEFCDKWADARAAIAALQAEPQGWMPIETAPKGRKVLAAYKNKLGNWRTVVARYYLPHTLLLEDDRDDLDDDGYAPEGWYEESETQDGILPIEEPPTHFQPLPTPPKD